jgi:hypothetical protein
MTILSPKNAFWQRHQLSQIYSSSKQEKHFRKPTTESLNQAPKRQGQNLHSLHRIYFLLYHVIWRYSWFTLTQFPSFWEKIPYIWKKFKSDI